MIHISAQVIYQILVFCKPLFNKEHLIGFSASTAHAPDIGGKIRSPEPREVYEEGLQIPMLKLINNGTVNETLMTILRKKCPRSRSGRRGLRGSN